MRKSSDEIDDVSPSMYKKLEEIGSPRLKAGRTHLVEIKDGKIDDRDKATGKRFFATQKYVEHYEDRFNAEKSLLYTDEFDVVFIEDGEGFGEALNKALKESSGWILFSADDKHNEEVKAMMKKCVMNPGTMHIGQGYWLFNKNAISLKKIGFDRISGIRSLSELISLWIPEKVVNLSDTEKVLEWHRDSIKAGKKYAIWGMGLSGSFLADTVKTSGGVLELAVDRDEEKQNTDFYGARVKAPEYLKEHGDEFDYLLVAHYSRFDEIYQQALEMGVPKDKIIMPYEV